MWLARVGIDLYVKRLRMPPGDTQNIRAKQGDTRMALEWGYLTRSEVFCAFRKLGGEFCRFSLPPVLEFR